MKFVVAFLACIVAAQAATFSCPSYDYWCAHNFHVLPRNSYYCYRIHFNHAWCTGAYYRDILVEFPKCFIPKGCEDENFADTRVNEMVEKLTEARAQIQLELFAQMQQWKKQVCEVNEYYVEIFREYFRRAYQAYTMNMYEQRVGAYKAELESLKKQAEGRYINQIHSFMLRIEHFHNQIIAQFRQALATRKTRVTCFHDRLYKKADRMIACYKEALEKLRLRKIAFVRNIFTCLYAGKAMPENFEEVITHWSEEMIRYNQVLVQGFYNEVYRAVYTIECDYRCFYKVYFRGNCYGLSRMHRRRSCVRLPCAPSTKFGLCGVSAFKADWSHCGYRSLKTCEKEQIVGGLFPYQFYIDEINKKYEGYNRELVLAYTEWHRQIDEWCTKALVGLEQIILCKYPRYYKSPTQAQIDQFHDLLREQAKVWVRLQKDKLYRQVECLYQKWDARIKQWKLCSEQMVYSVKAKWEACMVSRKSKVSIFTKCLYGKRDHTRACLEQRLKERARCHLIQFDKFFYSAFGTNPHDLIKTLRTHYCACVMEKVQKVLDKYDYFHLYWDPRIIVNYCCTHRINIHYKVPCMRLCLNWRLCAPSLHSCVFHC